MWINVDEDVSQRSSQIGSIHINMQLVRACLSKKESIDACISNITYTVLAS